MNVNDFTRRALAFLRQKRDLTAKGYRIKETDWEIHRGGRQSERIIDAIISVDGKYVYTKLGPKSPQSPAISAPPSRPGTEE